MQDPIAQMSACWEHSLSRTTHQIWKTSIFSVSGHILDSDNLWTNVASKYTSRALLFILNNSRFGYKPLASEEFLSWCLILFFSFITGILNRQFAPSLRFSKRSSCLKPMPLPTLRQNCQGPQLFCALRLPRSFIVLAAFRPRLASSSFLHSCF